MFRLLVSSFLLKVLSEIKPDPKTFLIKGSTSKKKKIKSVNSILGKDENKKTRIFLYQPSTSQTP